MIMIPCPQVVVGTSEKLAKVFLAKFASFKQLEELLFLVRAAIGGPVSRLDSRVPYTVVQCGVHMHGLDWI